MQNLAKTIKRSVVNASTRTFNLTYLAEFKDLLDWKSKEYGYYHLSNDAAEDTTWYDLLSILKDSNVEVTSVDLAKKFSLPRQILVKPWALDQKQRRQVSSFQLK